MDFYLIDSAGGTSLHLPVNPGEVTINREKMFETLECYKDRNWLYEKYVNEGLTISEIACICSRGKTTIRSWLYKFNIAIRKDYRCGRYHADVRGAKNPNWGKKLSPETRQKISKSLQGKALSQETRNKMSKSRTGKRFTWETKRKISQALKGREFSDEHKRNISKARSGRKITQEHKDKISKKLKGKRMGKESTGWGKPPGHGKRIQYTTNDGVSICMRSTWEARVADSLNALGVKWEYEPRRFTLRDRTYLPDFYLPELGVWYEVKGWLHERHQETIRQFRDMYPEEPIIVVTKHVLKMLESACVGG